MRTTSSPFTVLVACLLLAACGDSTIASPSPAGSGEPAALATDGATALRACEQDEFGCVQVLEGEPIVIGTALTLTGPEAARGLDAQYGAQVALNLRGEVLGHEVQLVNRDDRCDPDGGVAAASELSQLDGLVAVLGTSCSVAAMPTAEVLAARGIMLVSPSNTAPWLTDRSSRSPFYVRMAPDDDVQAAAMAEFACAELAVETAATIRDGSAFAAHLESTFAAEFADRCEGELTGRAVVRDGQASVARALAEIAVSNRGASPELLYVPLAGERFRAAAIQARRTPGLEDALLGGLRSGLDGRDESPEQNLNGEADDVYLSGLDLALSGQFYESIFLSEYSQVSGMEPLGVFHGHAYDAVNLILDAVTAVSVRTADGLYVPRGELLDALAATRAYRGLTGELACDVDGDCADTRVSVWQVQAGDFQQVWP